MAQKPKALAKSSAPHLFLLCAQQKYCKKGGQSKELAKRQIIKGLKSAQSFKSAAAFPGKKQESESRNTVFNSAVSSCTTHTTYHICSCAFWSSFLTIWNTYRFYYDSYRYCYPIFPKILKLFLYRLLLFILYKKY